MDTIKLNDHFILQENDIAFVKHVDSLTVNLYTVKAFENNQDAFTAHTISDPKYRTFKSFVKRWLKENKA